MTRALLARGVLLAGEPLFGLARHHRDQLAADLRDGLGYSLQISTDTARLYKPLTRAQVRPLPVPPRSASESRRPVDERRIMDARRCLLVCLIGAVLERRTLWSQVPLTELAADVLKEARAQELEVDWRRTADKAELLDAVAWLGGLGVLTLRSGSAQRFGESANDASEAYYDINRPRLAAVLADPIRLAGAQRADEIERPTPAAESQQARRQRLTRLLVEDPALYMADLDEADRQYFLGQRAPIERRAAELTGLQVERRREGSALIGAGRELTDRPFPAQSHRKQLALLLLAELCRIAQQHGQPDAEGGTDATVGANVTSTANTTSAARTEPREPEPRISLTRVRRTVAELLARHRGYWGLGDDAASEPLLTEAALALLEELMLLRRSEQAVELRPAAWRYRDVKAKVGAQQSLLGTEWETPQ